LYDCIGIDEGQFFPDIVPFCEKMANIGKTVIVAALDGTFQRKPFGSVLDLIPLAESVTKLSAVCMLCYNDASFTERLGDELAVEVIGGSDKYLAVCRQCYFSKPPPQTSEAEIPQSTPPIKKRANSLGTPSRLANHRRSSFVSPGKRIAKRRNQLAKQQRKAIQLMSASAQEGQLQDPPSSSPAAPTTNPTKDSSTPKRLAKRKAGSINK
jgi:hypothetical protein